MKIILNLYYIIVGLVLGFVFFKFCKFIIFSGVFWGVVVFKCVFYEFILFME